MLEKVVIWAWTQSGGDGSANIRFTLTNEEAEWAYENDFEGFSEDGIQEIETFIGSNVHQEAVKNRQEVQKAYYFKDKNWEERFKDYLPYYNYVLTPEEEAEVGMKFLEMSGDPDEWEDEDES